MTITLQAPNLKPPIATDGPAMTAAGPSEVQGSPGDWETLALCRTVPEAKDLFFSEELVDIGAAKRVCAECPVIAECLEGAIRRGEPWGVWGGQLFAKGRIVAIKRKRGRPPKNPRPEDQLPEIPVPAHLQKLIA